MVRRQGMTPKSVALGPRNLGTAAHLEYLQHDPAIQLQGTELDM